MNIILDLFGFRKTMEISLAMFRCGSVDVIIEPELRPIVSPYHMLKPCADKMTRLTFHQQDSEGRIWKPRL